MLLQYRGIPMGAGGTPVPYYVMDPSLGMGMAPAGNLRVPQQQAAQPAPQGGLMTAGYSQQGPVYMAAPGMAQQQAPAVPAQQYMQAQQYVPVQQWGGAPMQADAGAVWGYGGAPMQGGVMPSAGECLLAHAGLC